MSSLPSQKSENSHTYINDALALLIFSALIFYLIAIFSYHPADSAFNSVMLPPQKIQNLAGSVGASVSGFLIFYLGIGSFLLSIPGILFSFSILKNKASLNRFFTFVIGIFLFYLGLIHVFVLFVPNLTLNGFSISTVGFIGAWFEKNVLNPLGTAGSLTMSSLCFFLTLILLFRKSSLFSTFAFLSQPFAKKKT